MKNHKLHQSNASQLVRSGKPVLVRLQKDLVRSVLRGHAWLYSHSIETPEAASGSVAILLDRKNDERIASGIYDPHHPIPLRICQTQPPLSLDDRWLVDRIQRAAALRQAAFTDETTGYRLLAGEGDGVPGFIADVYDSTAVIKFDGGAPEAFYQPLAIAEWLIQNLQLDRVVLRTRERGRAGEILVGDPIDQPIEFLEHGLKFTADVLAGQKTGFFLDQRDNRGLIRQLAQGKSVLNLFSFNGGFSVAAGAGGATRVVSVDIAQPAIEAADFHWQLNHLPPNNHEAIAMDCFAYLQQSTREKFDIVICDPPSFAPNEKSRPQALAAYAKLAQLSAKVTVPGGWLALASCSSHVDHATFLDTNLEALGRARRKATLIADRCLPCDHPTPFAMPELRYLKFLLLQLD